MTTVLEIKPAKVRLHIAKKITELKFDFNAFAFIEEHAGSIAKAFELLNSGRFLAIKLFLEAGLLHLGDTKIKIDKKNISQKTLVSLSEALKQSLCGDYNFFEEWNWGLLYYTGTVVLNMSEESFWKCTPKKLLALLSIHREVQGVEVKEDKGGKEALQTFMSW